MSNSWCDRRDDHSPLGQTALSAAGLLDHNESVKCMDAHDTLVLFQGDVDNWLAYTPPLLPWTTHETSFHRPGARSRYMDSESHLKTHTFGYTHTLSTRVSFLYLLYYGRASLSVLWSEIRPLGNFLGLIQSPRNLHTFPRQGGVTH